MIACRATPDQIEALKKCSPGSVVVGDPSVFKHVPEPLFRIKPPEWEEREHEFVAECGAYCLSVAKVWGAWEIVCRGVVVEHGSERDYVLGKLAADAAFRKIVTQHLEQVT